MDCQQISEMRAKLLGIANRLKGIGASLQVAMNDVERCQNKLEDYCAKRKGNINTAAEKDRERETMRRQIRLLDLPGDDSYSERLEMEEDSNEYYASGVITMESLLKVDYDLDLDLDQLVDDLFAADAAALADDATANTSDGDTTWRNVTI